MAYIGRGVEFGNFEKQILIPDSVTTTFPLTFAVGSANSLYVNYGGVPQEPQVAYSVSGGGQQIVFSEAPVTGTTLYIIYYGKQLTTPRAAGQETTKQTLSGDGTTTLFTLTDPPVVPAGIMVFVDGILQREGAGNNYVSSGSTIAFTSAPDASAEIDVYTLVKEKVSIDTVADGSITRAKMAASFPYWDAAGNFGIGTSSPAYKLDAQTTATGTAAGDNTVAFFGSLASGRDANIRFGDNVNASARIGYLSGALYMYTNGAERLRLDLAGNLSMATTGAIVNSRINLRTITTTSTATLTPDIQADDQFNLTAQAEALTIAAPIGTPVDGNKIIIRILDNGISQTISWNATYTVIGTTLPTATTINKMTYVGCIYNAANTRWDVVAVTTQV